MKGLDKLIIGHTYTYKELCFLFEEKEKSSNSKKAQKKEWERHFKWINISKQKYEIIEIYKTPLPKNDMRIYNGGNSTGKYLLLDDIIMDYLEEGEPVSTTLPKLSIQLGLMTKQYETLRNNNMEFCHNNDISLSLMNTLLANINNCVLKAIRNSLERLNRDNYISLCSFYFVISINGEKIKLSKSESEKLIFIEKEIEAEWGVNRFEIIVKNLTPKFQKETQKRIREQLGYDIKYYYKEYDIKKLNKEYIHKSNENIWRLSRKFIITIGINMLKYVAYDKIDENQTELIKHIISLINYFFAYMNHDSWDAYWEEDELNWNNEQKALLFWSQYCLVESSDYHEKQHKLQLEQKRKEEKDILHKIECRNIAINSLGEEEILECEYILPNLDWREIVNNEEYAKIMGNAISQYHIQKDKMKYCQEPLAEDYCLYVARLYAKGKQDEQIPFYEFNEID